MSKRDEGFWWVRESEGPYWTPWRVLWLHSDGWLWTGPPPRHGKRLVQAATACRGWGPCLGTEPPAEGKRPVDAAEAAIVPKLYTQGRRHGQTWAQLARHALAILREARLLTDPERAAELLGVGPDAQG